MDSHWVVDGPLSQLRLMDDTRFPWLVLVPRIAGAVEWFELEAGEQRQLLDEVTRAGRLLKAEFSHSKINVGALGNIVRQLHVHVVARHADDAAWPGPVWGSGEALQFSADALGQRLAALRAQWARPGST